jgi:broad specificity phosphatase PhoE
VSSLRLVLVRHGQTGSNVRKVLDTRPPGAPLDEHGLKQAVLVAQRLAESPVTAVHASVAIRAQQTAAPIAAAHGLAVDVLDDVHEVFVGDLEGRSDVAAREEFDRVYDAWWKGDLGAHLPGGESAEEVRERFVPAVKTITADARGDVVLVSHGAAIRVGAAALLGDTVETQYVPNTGLVVLRVDPTAPAGWTLDHWDTAERVPGDITAGGTPA